jgi:hypothetical protein
MSFNDFNKTFDTFQELMRYYDAHSGTYTHYIFAIGYFRRDELPDVNDPRIREKYRLGAREVVNVFD